MPDQAKQAVFFVVLFLSFSGRTDYLRGGRDGGLLWLERGGRPSALGVNTGSVKKAVTSALVRLLIFHLSPFHKHHEESFVRTWNQMYFSPEINTKQIGWKNFICPTDRAIKMIFHTFITICASHLCCGSDSFPQISSSLRADNGLSECSLLQNESTLIVQTCNPHLHKSICSISKGTTPLLSTSSPPAPDE